MQFAGLSYLGWMGFLFLWVVQAAVFWTGMDSIRRFIDWAGPAVYVVMIILAIYLVSRAARSWASRRRRCTRSRRRTSGS